MSKIKVFMSSTEKDLPDHRKAVIAALKELNGFEPVYTGAAPEKTAQWIDKKISECELFVGVLVADQPIAIGEFELGHDAPSAPVISPPRGSRFAGSD